MRRYSMLIGLGFLWLAAWTSGQLVLERFEARTEGSAVVVTWEARVEQEVQQYVLERKRVHDVDFLGVKTFAPHGEREPYIYKDTQVYKRQGDPVLYRLKVRFKDGQMLQMGPIAVDYTSTAVRRTWGSLKAMFQE